LYRQRWEAGPFAASADSEHISCHEERIPQCADATLSDLYPIHRDFGDLHPELLREAEQFNVERKPSDPHEMEQNPRDGRPEGLEAALCVPKRQIRDCTNHCVEATTKKFPLETATDDHGLVV
jgi:hypothetical protein